MIFPSHPRVRFFSIKSPGSAWIEDIYQRHDLDFDAARVRAAYESEMQSAPGRQPIISQEALLCEVFAGGSNVIRNAQRLQALFPRGKILIVIREQLDMIASLYYQYCQEGGTVRMARFLTNGPPNVSYFDWTMLDYARLLEYYQSVFGAEQVKMIPFEHFKRDPLEFVTAIMAFCNLDAPPALNDVIATEPSNIRTTRYGLHFMRVMNLFLFSRYKPSSIIPSFVFSHHQMRAMTFKVLDPYVFRHLPAARKQVKIPDTLRQQLIEFYTPGNRKLSQQHHLPVDTYGYVI
jgi:hypothetical protein